MCWERAFLCIHVMFKACLLVSCGAVSCFRVMFQSLLVGLLDADVYGPSIPKMMNLKGPVNITKRKCCMFLRNILHFIYSVHRLQLYSVYLYSHFSFLLLLKV